MKKPRAEWEIARENWLKELQERATTDDRQHFRELKESGLYNPFEIIERVFGWRCPTAKKVWFLENKTGEKLGTHQAAEYLLRAVLGIPTDGSVKDIAFHRETKKSIQDLIVRGHDNGHVISDSGSIRDAARVAVNDTFKKLGLKS